jgi:hypothetical protein
MSSPLLPRATPRALLIGSGLLGLLGHARNRVDPVGA